MSIDTVNLLTKKSRAKIDLLNESKLKYLISAMFAGIYVGIGVILVFTIGGMLHQVHSPMTKIAVGLSFSVALSLILILGNELFTSNNMVMTVGIIGGETTKRDALKVLAYSYLGNFLGALLVAILFVGTGLFKDSTLVYFEYSALAKIEAEAYQLFFRGILCNILVCSAVLSAYKLKDETSRLIIVFLSLFAFVTSGFEHCIANMATFLICVISNSTAVGLAGMIYNLFFVTIGNLVGGVLFLGVGTYLMSDRK